MEYKVIPYMIFFFLLYHTFGEKERFEEKSEKEIIIK